MINDMCINKNRRHRRVIRKVKNMMRKMEKKKKKENKKKTKMTSSPRQGLNPDHGPQHGAVRCSTHWAAGNLSVCEIEL